MNESPPPQPDFDGVPLAKLLLRTVRAGALATLDGGTGFPFASLVTVATDLDGSPLLLMSRLAAHTANLDRDPRASILLAQGGKGDPLAHPRLTVLGRIARTRGAARAGPVPRPPAQGQALCRLRRFRRLAHGHDGRPSQRRLRPRHHALGRGDPHRPLRGRGSPGRGGKRRRAHERGSWRGARPLCDPARAALRLRTGVRPASTPRGSISRPATPWRASRSTGASPMAAELRRLLVEMAQRARSIAA